MTEIMITFLATVITKIFRPSYKVASIMVRGK